MSRRRRQEAQGVQLFPFLDVLLSAMGALILLLAVASRNLSRQEAQLASELPNAEELRIRREMVEWEIEQLRVQRDKTAGDLSDERLKLGHLEQHARQLRDEVNELARAEGQLVAPTTDDEEQAAAELRELRSRITAARHALEEALAKNAGKEATYAIVPYHGPNETRRRPIYIECRATEIVLQPEGVVLTMDDFDGPFGPGNPLAAAVRAAREHLSRLRHSSAGDSSEPYPLLLVRPEGIEMFYAARAALDTWGSEFGYEFIESDWKIDYQKSDAELAAVEQDAVDTAREQQKLIAELAPRVQRNATARTFRASRTGGIEAADGNEFGGGGRGYGGGPRSFGSRDPYGTRGGYSPERSDRTSAGGGGWATAAERAGSAGDGYGYGRGEGDLVEVGPEYNGGLPDQGRSQNSAALTAPYRAALESARAREAWAASQQGGGGNATAGGGPERGYGGGALAGEGLAATGSALSAPGMTGSATTDAVASGGDGANAAANAGGSVPGGNAAGNPAGTNATSDGSGEGPSFPSAASGATATGGSATSNGATAANGSMGAPGLSAGPPAQGATSAPFGGTSPLGSGAPSDPSVTPGIPSFGAQFGEPGQQPEQLTAEERQRRAKEAPRSPFDTAGKARGTYSQSRPGRGGSSSGGGRPSSHRGNNWALPESAQSSVPLSRPIRVECGENRITIYSDRGRGAITRVVEFGPQTEDSINEFVSAIWDHMEGWGIAGDGFYWHPILNLHVAPRGEARASELKAALADSGLEIRDPKAPARAAQRPAVRGTATPSKR